MDYLKPFGCDVIKQVDTYDLIELCRHIILFCSILFSLKNECDTIIFDRLVEKKMGNFFFICQFLIDSNFRSLRLRSTFVDA